MYIYMVERSPDDHVILYIKTSLDITAYTSFFFSLSPGPYITVIPICFFQTYKIILIYKSDLFWKLSYAYL